MHIVVHNMIIKDNVRIQIEADLHGGMGFPWTPTYLTLKLHSRSTSSKYKFLK